MVSVSSDIKLLFSGFCMRYPSQIEVGDLRSGDRSRGGQGCGDGHHRRRGAHGLDGEPHDDRHEQLGDEHAAANDRHICADASLLPTTSTRAVPLEVQK